MERLGFGEDVSDSLTRGMLTRTGCSCKRVSDGSASSSISPYSIISLSTGTLTIRSSYSITFLTRISGDFAGRKRGRRAGEVLGESSACDLEQWMVMVGFWVRGIFWDCSTACLSGRRSFSCLGCCWCSAESSSSIDSNPMSLRSMSSGNSRTSLSPRSRSNLQSLILVGDGCTNISLNRGDSQFINSLQDQQWKVDASYRGECLFLRLNETNDMINE